MKKNAIQPIFTLALTVLVFCSACATEREQLNLIFQGVSEDLAVKKITPEMELRMEALEDSGCFEKHEVKNVKMSKTAAVFPGGGQFYNGEPVKGLYYMATSIFILPYMLAHQDAKETTAYLNFKSTLEFCEEKLRLEKEHETTKSDSKNASPISGPSTVTIFSSSGSESSSSDSY